MPREEQNSIFDRFRGILRNARKTGSSAAGNKTRASSWATAIPNPGGGPAGRALGVIPARGQTRVISSSSEADVATGVSLVFSLRNPAPVTGPSANQTRMMAVEITWGNGNAVHVMKADVSEGTRLSLHSQVAEVAVLEETPPPAVISPARRGPSIAACSAQARQAGTRARPGPLPAHRAPAVGAFIGLIPEPDFGGALFDLILGAPLGPCPAPTSISPNQENLGNVLVGAEISGSGFPDPVGVEFQPTEGQFGPPITSPPTVANVVVSGAGTLITLDIDCSTASIGIYDVIVFDPSTPQCRNRIVAGFQVLPPA